MADRIQLRRDTKANWESYNPILLEGEPGHVLDYPNLYKMGDGIHAWNDLPYRGYDGTILQMVNADDENSVPSSKAVYNALKPLGDAISSEEKIYVDISEGNRYVNYQTGEYVSSETSTNYANEIQLDGSEYEVQYYSANFVSNPGGYAFLDENNLLVYGAKIKSSASTLKVIGNDIIKYALDNGAVKLRLSLYYTNSNKFNNFKIKRLFNISPIDRYSLEKYNPLSSRTIGFKMAKDYEILDYIGNEISVLPYMISEIDNIWRKYPSGSTGERFCILIPTKDVNKFLIHANGDINARIAFLNTEPVEEIVPPYCDGWSNIHTIYSNTEELFIVPDDAKYLYVRLGYLSNNNYEAIPNSIKVWGALTGSMDINELSDIEKKQTNRNIVIGSPQIYSSPVRTTIGSLYNTTYSEMYAAMDELVSNYPDWISRESDIGNDSDGQPIRHYILQWKHSTYCVQNYGQYEHMFINDLKNRANETFLKRRALLMSGVHGSEKGAVWGLIYFLQDLLSSNEQWAEFIKSNYMLDIIPVICPWAIDNKSRTNKNGINVNRDYSNNPTSEEAIAVVSYMKKIEGDISCIFDCHTYSGNLGFYSINENNLLKSTLVKLFNAVIASKVNDWNINIKGNLVSSANIYRNPFCFVCRSTNSGTMAQYGMSYTPFSVTIESVWSSNDSMPILAKQTSDMIGNALQSLLTVIPLADELNEIGGYNVTINTNSNAAAMVQEYPTFIRKGSSLKIPVMVGVKGHENIIITMGGVDITSTAYDIFNNIINIPFVTDDVVININEEILPSGYTPVILSTELNKKVDTLLKGDLNTEITLLSKSNSFNNNYLFGDVTNKNKAISVPCSSNAKFGSTSVSSYNAKAVFSDSGYSLMTVNKNGIFNQFGKQFEWNQEPSAFETEGNIYIGIANGIDGYSGVAENKILSIMIVKNDVIVFNARAVQRNSDNVVGFWDYVRNTFFAYE